MPEPLHVSAWWTRQWGGATDLAIEDVPPGMVVVYGRNESGKSSSAEAIAWLLAGPGTEADLHHLGPSEDPLHAKLLAELADQTLSIEVSSKVPLNSTQRKVKEKSFAADLNGLTIEREDLRKQLGNINLTDLRRYFWVDAEKVHAKRPADSEESLSTSTLFGGLKPFTKADELNEEGHKSLGKQEGQGAAKGSGQEFAYSIKKIAVQIKEARNAQPNWGNAKRDVEDAEEQHRTASGDLEKTRNEVRLLKQAIDAIPRHDDLKRAADDLADTPRPTDDHLKFTANQTAIRSALDSLARCRKNLREARKDLRDAEAKAGDWSDLVDDLDLADGVIDDIRAADAQIVSRRAEHVQADAALAAIEAIGLSATPSTPETEDAGWALRAPVLTAIGLSAAAVIGALGDQPAAAAVLGFLAFAALLVPRLRRPGAVVVSSSHGETDDQIKKEAAKRRRLLDTAIERRTELALSFGVPAHRIRDSDERLAPRFDAVMVIQDAKNSVDEQSTYEEDAVTGLAELIPVAVEPATAEAELDTALSIKERHDRAIETKKTARQNLRDLPGGTNTDVNHLLENDDLSTLETRLAETRDKIAELEELFEDTKSNADRARTDLLQIQDEADYQTPVLAYEAERSQLRGKVVNGLAHQLASQVLTTTAEAYAGDNKADLIEIVNDLARSISDGWMQVRMDTRSDRLIVRSARGETPEDRLATGARSILTLCFRLAKIRTEAKILKVLLPTILDDPLVHVDGQRRRAAFSVLNRFAEDHQVLYFTCHEQHAKEAQDAGAHFVELRGSGA